MRRVNFVDCFVWRSEKMTGGGISAAVACDFCERKSFDTYCRWIVFEAEERYGGDVLYLYLYLVLVLVLYLSLSSWGREIWHTTHPGPVLFPCHWKEGQLLMPFHYAKMGLRWASNIDHGDDDYHDHHGHDDHAQSVMLLMMMMWTATNAFTLR